MSRVPSVSGDSMRRLRVRAKLTQKQLARRIGCSQAHVSNVERGQVAASEGLVKKWKGATNGRR